MAHIIDGKRAAARLLEAIKSQVTEARDRLGLIPGLATILVGDDPASNVYVSSKVRQTREAGMHSVNHKLPSDTTEAELLRLIEDLNSDPGIHGILVQLPLPDLISRPKVTSAIHPDKDVDGFHPLNVGQLSTGRRALLPCTPLGCILLLREYFGSLRGKNAVVIGRSNIVGRPMAQLLLAEDCTVVIAHRFTENLRDHCKAADVLVTAVGKPELIPGAWIKPDAVVIDVGINRVERGGRFRLVGDVDFTSAVEVAQAITPVPGGVGPMTIACLLYNTLTAFCRANGMADPEVPGLGTIEDIGIVNEFARAS